MLIVREQYQICFVTFAKCVYLYKPHRWCNGERARLCGRSWVRAPIRSHQRLRNRYLLLLR